MSERDYEELAHNGAAPSGTMSSRAAGRSPAALRASSEELAQNGPRPARHGREFLVFMAPLARGPYAIKQLESARQARSSLALVRQRLLNPTAKTLESCTSHLRTAIDPLTTLQDQLQHGESRSGPELRTEVSALHAELAQVNALLKNGYAFHVALAHLLTQTDDSINYGASGIVAIRPASTVLLEG